MKILMLSLLFSFEVSLHSRYSEITMIFLLVLVLKYDILTGWQVKYINRQPTVNFKFLASQAPLDAARVSKWSISQRGYITTILDNKTIKLRKSQMTLYATDIIM